MTNFERVIPLLVYRDIQAAHDFLVQAFGFESGGVQRIADGEVVHGEVRAGGSSVWRPVSHKNMSWRRHRPWTWPAPGWLCLSQTLTLISPALSQSAPRSISNRPISLMDSASTGRDAEGHRWWFATPTAVLQPA
jgi:hypothetical protein